MKWQRKSVVLLAFEGTGGCSLLFSPDETAEAVVDAAPAVDAFQIVDASIHDGPEPNGMIADTFDGTTLDGRWHAAGGGCAVGGGALHCAIAGGSQLNQAAVFVEIPDSKVVTVELEITLDRVPAAYETYLIAQHVSPGGEVTNLVSLDYYADKKMTATVYINPSPEFLSVYFMNTFPPQQSLLALMSFVLEETGRTILGADANDDHEVDNLAYGFDLPINRIGIGLWNTVTDTAANSVVIESVVISYIPSS